MPAIGGYFELADFGEGSFPHIDGILLNTGRNSLEYILRCLGNVKRAFIPYYDCEVILEPLKKLRIPWVFYHINTHFEMVDDICLQDGDYIIVNNFWGIKDAYVNSLAKRYGDHLIVDCAQAFFAKPIPGVHSFYSPRKFIGVADGGIAYMCGKNGASIIGTEITELHDSHLYIRKECGAEAGFEAYRENERKLDNQPIRMMSQTTERILDHIDYEKVVSRRRENFAYLHSALGERNLVDLPDLQSFACPMVYPFLADNPSLRHKLIENGVFVATYWPNVIQWTGSDSVEYELAEKLIPLPIDQRYALADMRRILLIMQR